MRIIQMRNNASVLMLLAPSLERSVAAFVPSYSVVNTRAATACSGGPTVRRFASTSPQGSSSTLETQEKRLFPEEINIIYDSKCNVCKLEIDWLASRDLKENSGKPKLKMTDLESGSYNENDPANGGIDYETGMAAIHAITPDGKVLKGVPVFRVAYTQVGLGWLFAIAEWPFFHPLLNWGYEVFAKYRTNFTRGSSLEKLVEAYDAKKSLENCEVCKK
jgi:predicted DCC family thiol-disulfide oxidoreductase YuxK